MGCLPIKCMYSTYHLTSGSGNPSTLQSNVAMPLSGARISDILLAKLGLRAAVKYEKAF